MPGGWPRKSGMSKIVNAGCLKLLSSNIFFILRVVLGLKSYMKTGIPDAGVPPLDPLNLDNVALSLAGAKVEFRNINMSGLSDHSVTDVKYDEGTR